MTWVEGSLVLFGGLVAVMALGLPVAFAFLASTSWELGSSSAVNLGFPNLLAIRCSRSQAFR